MDDGGTKFFDVEGRFHAVWDFDFFWCEVFMSRFSIVFDAHYKCMKGLLSDYSLVMEACDCFLGMVRI